MTRFHYFYIYKYSVYETLQKMPALLNLLQPLADFSYCIPELVVLVDFKAVYPGVPPGILASFQGEFV